ncbi:MAG: TsoY family (seleno)protein [Oscillochloridaceae bacterium umkhey_bin13]
MLSLATRWFGLRRNLGEQYSPAYFLAALGNGGIAITFFIWLNFLVPHPKTPIITYDGIVTFLGQTSLLGQGLIFIAMAGILFFAVRHLRLVVWNLREYSRFKQTAAYTALRESQAAVSLMGLPLMLAMTVNVFFVLGAVFVPGLWNVVEYLFPFSLTAFLLIGALAIRMFFDSFGKALVSGKFDCARNNSLSQFLAAFTFSMIGVGLAAPAAMSENRLTIAFSLLASLFFLGAALIFGLILLVLGFRGMITQGLAVEAAPSLWMPIPMLTLVGITLVRMSHGLHHAFEAHIDPAWMFMLTGGILMLQLLVGLIGYVVMRQVGYFRTFLWGERRSPASYGLVCPAVALAVFGFFFIHPGLVQNGLVDKYSLAHMLLLLPFAAVQLLGIVTILRLDSKLIRPEPGTATMADPAAA